MGPSHEGSIRRPIAPCANTLTTELHFTPVLSVSLNKTFLSFLRFYDWNPVPRREPNTDQLWSWWFDHSTDASGRGSPVDIRVPPGWRMLTVWIKRIFVTLYSDTDQRLKNITQRSITDRICHIDVYQCDKVSQSSQTDICHLMSSLWIWREKNTKKWSGKRSKHYLCLDVHIVFHFEVFLLGPITGTTVPMKHADKG